MTTFYEKARAFAEANISPVAGKIDEEGKFPADVFDKIGAEGFFKLLIPEDQGGLGGTLQDHEEVVLAFAESCPTVGLSYMMHNVALHTVLSKSYDELKARIIDEVVNNNKVLALAYSEFGTGTHFYIPESTVTRDGDTFKINGTKSMVTMAGYANYHLLLTQTSDGSEGISNWVVPVDSDGVEEHLDGWHGMGMTGNSSAPVQYKDVALDESWRINAEGDGMNQVLEQVAPPFILGLAAVYTGLSVQQAALSAQYAQDRVYPDGQAIADLDTVQLHVGDIYRIAESSKAFTREAGRALVAGEADALAKILAARIHASEGAIEASRLAMRVGGGKTYNKSSAIERLTRDSFGGQIMAPSVDVLHLWLGRALVNRPLI